MTTRLLSEPEYRETFSSQMIDIQGREPVLQPEGVIDVEPYLKAVPASDLRGVALLSAVPPAAVYRCRDGRFDHAPYPCNQSNVYLVIVIALHPDHIHGHYLLDLAKEYGLDVSGLTAG